MTTPPTSAPDPRDKQNVNGDSVPDAIIVALHTIARIVADAVEPVFTFVAGGAAVGAAVYCAWVARADEPNYGRGRPKAPCTAPSSEAVRCFSTSWSAANTKGTVIQLSIRVLSVGLVLAALLAVAANVFTLPAWSIYLLFVTIIG